ncbi:MAG TPA: hypothetical protein VG271_13500 [Beijerinckiaceae bacterium]|nr:hypothetical protein [Beijerinckiaceae bacterium]
MTRGLFAVIDDCDADDICRYRWHATSLLREKVYAARKTADGGVIFMHRQILPPPLGLIVDHIDGFTLRNIRANLRIATHSQNRVNSERPGSRGPNASRFRGVQRSAQANGSRGGKIWECRLRLKDRNLYLGSFHAEEDAALAYDTAAKQYFGEFARLNFPYHQHAPLSGETTLSEASTCIRTEKTGQKMAPEKGQNP